MADYRTAPYQSQILSTYDGIWNETDGDGLPPQNLNTPHARAPKNWIFNGWKAYTKYFVINLLADGLPPANVRLSDWAVAAVVDAGVDQRTRSERWPADFNSVGRVRLDRLHLDPPAKTIHPEHPGTWYYRCYRDVINLIGEEGLNAGLSARTAQSFGSAIGLIDITVSDVRCVIQSDRDKSNIDRNIHPTGLPSIVPDDLNREAINLHLPWLDQELQADNPEVGSLIKDDDFLITRKRRADTAEFSPSEADRSSPTSRKRQASSTNSWPSSSEVYGKPPSARKRQGPLIDSRSSGPSFPISSWRASLQRATVRRGKATDTRPSAGLHASPGLASSSPFRLHSPDINFISHEQRPAQQPPKLFTTRPSLLTSRPTATTDDVPRPLSARDRTRDRARDRARDSDKARTRDLIQKLKECLHELDRAYEAINYQRTALETMSSEATKARDEFRTSMEAYDDEISGIRKDAKAVQTDARYLTEWLGRFQTSLAESARAQDESGARGAGTFGAVDVLHKGGFDDVATRARARVLYGLSGDGSEEIKDEVQD
ncbi:MAG: hypothetical protein M1819_000491 [Sarea resinae]|nr:MAG: hypothetical protein M1819_000491 [Sarea resinae]